jgi:hypothetical protein
MNDGTRGAHRDGVDALPFLLIVGGLTVAAFGLLTRGGRIGRLPGDMTTRRGPVTVYAPLGTSLLLSVLITLALNLALCGAFR